MSTISKSGASHFQRRPFENLQNSELDASNTFSNQTPTLKMNNFGAYVGGPVIIPKLYNGTNKTFFFVSLESLQLPRTLQYVESVPTVAMRNGDLSAYLTAANGDAANQLTGYPGNIIPASKINPDSLAALNAFYPLPNLAPVNPSQPFAN